MFCSIHWMMCHSPPSSPDERAFVPPSPVNFSLPFSLPLSFSTSPTGNPLPPSLLFDRHLPHALPAFCLSERGALKQTSRCLLAPPTRISSPSLQSLLGRLSISQGQGGDRKRRRKGHFPGFYIPQLRVRREREGEKEGERDGGRMDLLVHFRQSLSLDVIFSFPPHSTPLLSSPLFSSPICCYSNVSFFLIYGRGLQVKDLSLSLSLFFFPW